MFTEGHQLQGHTSSIEAGFTDAQARATRFADPSWYAFQGYVQASHGREGAGHLAWERIAMRHRALRDRAGSKSDDRKLAYVLGYARGLADHGRTSAAEASQLLGVFLPPARQRKPVYARSRFWLFVVLLFTFTFSQVGAAEFNLPDYPVISEPLNWTRPIAPAAPTASTPPSADEDRELIDAVASGATGWADAEAAIRVMPPARAARVARELLMRVAAPLRVQIVDAVAHIPDERVALVIRRALSDAEPAVVETALAALVGRGDRESLTAVQSLLRHDSPRVRRVAVEALSSLGGRDQAEYLLPTLHDESPEVRRAVRGALTVLVGRDLGPKLRPWRAHLDQNH